MGITQPNVNTELMDMYVHRLLKIDDGEGAGWPSRVSEPFRLFATFLQSSGLILGKSHIK